MTTPVVSAIVFELNPPVEVEGRSAKAGQPNRYRAERLIAKLTGGRADAMLFDGPKHHLGGGMTPYRQRFTSDDPALATAKLTARRVAATAAQRAVTGAK